MYFNTQYLCATVLLKCTCKEAFSEGPIVYLFSETKALLPNHFSLTLTY